MITTNVKQSLLNQFNIDNHVSPPIQMTDVDFLTPEIWLQGECNSRVKIQGSASSNDFGGQETIYFIRRRIEADLLDVKVPGKPTDYSRYFDVLRVLREKLGLPLQESEYLDKAFAGTVFKIDVTTVSMAYLPGGSITLQFEESN
jgi:hypothetical protein